MVRCLLLMAAAWGQTTEPAGVSASRPAMAVATRPAGPAIVARPTTQPAGGISALGPGGPAIGPGGLTGLGGFDIGQLSGNPVEVEVTSDGTLMLYGDERDVAILQAFIETMDQQPLFKPEFRIFKLSSGDANDLARKIQQLWDAAKRPATGQMRPEDRMTIVPEPRSNILMVAAPEASMEQIEQIVTQLDQPAIGGVVQFESVQLKYIKAAEAEATLKDLLKSLQERRGATRELVTIKASPRLNMLLINAPEADLKQIREWINLIDVEPTVLAGSVVKMAIFPLEKAKATDVIKALEGMLKAETDAAKAAAEQIRRLQVVKKSPDGSEKQLKDLNLEKPIKLLVEEGSNSVIVATVEENLEPVGELVRILDTLPLAADMVVNVYPLNHADVEVVAKSLQDVFKQGQALPEVPGQSQLKRVPQNLPGEALAYNVGISADKRTNTLIVSGRAEQMLLVGQIVKAMDIEKTFGKYAPQLVKLEHASVKTIADVVTKLAEQRQKVLSQAVTPAVAERDRAVVIPDVRTNSLIIVATEEDFKELAKLATDLDGAEADWLGQIRIVNLVEDLPATEIASRIQELWERRAALRKEGGLPEDKPVVIADTRSNSLVVASSQDDFAAIEGLVKKLAAQKIAPMADIRLLSLKHNDVGKVSEIVRKLFDERLKMSKTEGQKEQPSERIAIVEDPMTRTMLVASSKANFEEVSRLVSKLDVPATAEGVYKAFFVQYADPENAAKFLDDFFKQGLYFGSGSAKDLPESATKVSVVSDARTRAVIVSASPQNLAIVESLLGQIDRKEVPTLFAPRIVKLEHADVKTIGDVVQKLVDQQQKIVEQTSSKAAAERERTLVIPDVRTNSLIIVARDEHYESLSSLVRRLDGAEEDWLGQIHIINLQNLTATDLSSKIEDLWKRRAEKRREGGLPEDMPVIVSDTRSNSLVIASSPADFESIMGLINKLEAQRLSPMSEIRLIALKNNDATKVADLIKKLWDERLKNSLAEGQKEQPSDRIAITDDPLTRTILLASSKSNYEEILQLVAKLDVPPVVDGLFRVFTIRNADISKAGELLKDLFDKGLYQGSGDKKSLPEWATKVTIVPDLRSSSLIVSGSPQNLQIVESLLKEVDREDVPTLPAGAAFFPIRHADVVNVADLLDQMFEGMKAGMSSDQKDQLEAKIVPDTRSRVLIVAGTKLAIKRAEELVRQLDQETTGAAYVMQVYKLKEASASKLEPVMTELFEKRATQEQTGKRTPIHIIADDGSNSLVVTASADDHQMAKQLIGMLDRKSTIAEQLHVIRLEKAQADQVSEMLQKLIEKQQTGDKKAGGFAVTPEPRTNSLLVWASPDLLNQIRAIVEQLDNTRPKAEMALRVFPLKNAKAEDLGELLDDFFEKAGAGKGATDKDARQMIIKFVGKDPATGEDLEQTLVHQDITISPDKNTNSLMVLAPEKHMPMVEVMVRMLDSVEPQTADIQVFTLRNADATEMQKLLEDLLQVGKGGTSEERRQFVLAGGEGAAPAAGGGASMEIAFAVDERTNSVIAAGSTSQLKVVEQLVLKLDYQEMEDRIVSVVQLRNRPAEDVAKTMKAYYEEESQAYEKVAGEGEARLRQFQRQVNIQEGGEGSNTLVVSYNPRMESQVVNMINELDRAPAMVMIQVLIAEVTLNDQFEMGMEFALQDLMFSENAYTGPNGTLQGDHYDVIGGTDVGATGESALGGISLTVTGEDFNFLVRALQTEGRLEILSRPSILVQDNQDAEITIGERVPTVQDVVVSGNGVVTPSVTYEDVGVILKVTPIVNPDGFVSMKIEPEISAIGTSSVTVSTGVTLPTFTERSAKTSVTVRDNETIIIGGLITSRENSGENKVPLVGDVPVLGNLFRATVRKNSKTELLMVLTPHVVRTPEEAQALSIQMRDQTGLIDNIRRSPLMQRLQVRQEEDQFGPDSMLKPTGEQKPRAESGELLGPEVEPLGPPVSATTRPAGERMAVTVETPGGP